MDDIVHDKPSDVEDAPGVVMVSGPDGVAVSMTPDAAARTGGKLLEHAAAAQGKSAIAENIELRRERGAGKT